MISTLLIIIIMIHMIAILIIMIHIIPRFWALPHVRLWRGGRLHSWHRLGHPGRWRKVSMPGWSHPLVIVPQGTIAMTLTKWTPTTKLRWGQLLEGWNQSVHAIPSSQSLVGWPWSQNHDDHVAGSPNAALGFNVSDVEWWWPSPMYSVTYNMRPSCIEIYASPSKNIKNISYKRLDISSNTNETEI